MSASALDDTVDSSSMVLLVPKNDEIWLLFLLEQASGAACFAPGMCLIVKW